MVVGQATNLEAVAIMPSKRHGMSMNMSGPGLPGRGMASMDIEAIAMMAMAVVDGVAAGTANKHVWPAILWLTTRS